ncbi:NUDIX hydrolase [Dactylosporangium cerinum]
MMALPGGGLQPGESILTGAAREFWEETGTLIPNHAVTHVMDFVPDNNDPDDEYAAGFFQVSLAELMTAESRIEHFRLWPGFAAAQQVQVGAITQYHQIHQRYADAPIDNELDHVIVWNLADPHIRAHVATWRNQPPLDWFFEILDFLSFNLGLGPLVVVGDDRRVTADDEDLVSVN